MNQLVLKITNPTEGAPLPPVQWNYDELRAGLTEALAKYDGLVYTEDTVQQAKKDRATLNKVRDAIDSERKRVKALYLAPYETFEAQAKELTALVTQQSSAIDAQIKAYDETRKERKLEYITDLYKEVIGDLYDLVPLSKLQSPKWLNVSVSVKSIEDEMREQVARIRAALASIRGLGSKYEQQMLDRYLKDFDLAAAIAEKDRLEKQADALERQAALQAAQAAQRKEVNPEPERPVQEQAAAPHEHAAEPSEPEYVIDFRVWASSSQLNKLKQYLVSNGIKYGRVPESR